MKKDISSKKLLKEILDRVSELYSRLEDETPPSRVSEVENAYNKGFFWGRINAMEKVCQDVFGITGDDISKKDETPQVYKELLDTLNI